MTYPDVAVIGAVASGAVIIVGAIVRGTIRIIRELKKLREVTVQKLDETHEKVKHVETQTNGNLVMLQSKLEAAEKRNADLMAIIAAIRPMLDPKEVAEAGVKTRLSDLNHVLADGEKKGS